MICTILILIIIILEIYLSVNVSSAYKKSEETKKVKLKREIFDSALFIVIMLIIASTDLFLGYYFSPDLERKAYIEDLLSERYDSFTIKMAEKYNSDVNSFNNYFYRFTIDDRSEYLIDIESFK